MELKFGLSLIFVCLCVTTLTSSFKFNRISDCLNYSTQGGHYLTFICATNVDNQKRNRDYWGSSCNYAPSAIYSAETLSFENCRFPTMDKNYFYHFYNVHTFLIPDVELEKMEMNTFEGARNLKILDVSHNNLFEIPSRIFSNSTKLEYVDFSYNSIKHIDFMAFDGATSLRTLNLSNNQIELDSRTLNISNLLTLDLSNNNLVQLPENAFDKLVNLKRLNLMFNAFGNLDVKTFSYLTQLEDLNLKQTNLTNIQLGTFSNQRKLVSLDLSGNGLKELDFQLFYPIQLDLRSLHLGYNQLRNLNGFRKSLFPKLNSLSIQGNEFRCTSLAYLMESTDWIHLNLDGNLINVNKSNIRGISCDELEEAELEHDSLANVGPTQRAQTNPL